ncbi:MAG: hypothetical protein HQL71_05930, partial [Magnetococcales bacterium]|nr:hypothetical protein [Magnetococcales bacterium]
EPAPVVAPKVVPEPAPVVAPKVVPEPAPVVKEQSLAQPEVTASALATTDNTDKQKVETKPKLSLDEPQKGEDNSMQRFSNKARYRELDQYSPLSLLQDPPSIIDDSPAKSVEKLPKLLADDQLDKIADLLEDGLAEEATTETAILASNTPELIKPKAPVIKPPQDKNQKEDVKDRANSSFKDEQKPKKIGVEMVGVNLDTFAGKNRERYFFGLLSNIASQLSLKAHIKTRDLESTLNDLVRHVREGGAISDPNGVAGLLKLGEQIEKLDLSVIQSDIVESLDEAFMGLANFLRGYIKDISKLDPVDSPLRADVPVPSASNSRASSDISATELENLMSSFVKHQQIGRKSTNNLSVPLVASSQGSDVSQVALNLEKLLNAREQQLAKQKRAKPVAVVDVDNSTKKQLKTTADKEKTKLEQVVNDTAPDMVKLMAEFNLTKQKEPITKPEKSVEQNTIKQNDSAVDMDKLLKTFEKEEVEEDIEHSDRKHLKGSGFNI